MKKLLIGFIALVSFQAFAGEILNRSTGERIVLSVDTEKEILNIESLTPGVRKNIKLKEVKKGSFDANYFPLTNAWLGVVGDVLDDDTASYITSYIIPPFCVVSIGASALDIVVLPVQVINSAFKNGKINKDYKVLLKAISTNQTVEVGNKRYERISQLLR